MDPNRFRELLDERARQDIEESRVVEIHGELATAYAASFARQQEIEAELERTRNLLNQSRDANHLMFSKLHAHDLGLAKEEEKEDVKDIQEEITVDVFLKGFKG